MTVSTGNRQRAFLYINGLMVDLNTLSGFTTAYPDYVLTEGLAINGGYVLVKGIKTDGTVRDFVIDIKKAFAFTAPVISYSVTTSATNCSVANGSGTASANVTNVVATCN